MANIIEDLGYWLAAPYGDGWTTFKRENEDGTITIWNEMARDYCPLDPNGVMVSSVHPFYVRVKAGVVLNCSPDLWRLVPHECFVYAIDEAVTEGWTLENGVFAPPPPPPYVPRVLLASVLYGRMTEDEFDALDDSVLAGETRRVYRAFSTASEFVEDDENWTILVRHLGEIVTAGRLAALMV